MNKSNNNIEFVVLIIMQIILIAILPLWFVIAGISLMAFDSGYSTDAVIFVASIWSYPIVLLVFSVLSWSKFKKRKSITALILMLCPLIPVVIYGFLVFIS